MGEQPALAITHALAAQQQRLILEFDALGNHLELQGMGHANDVRGDAAAGGVVPQGIDECLVDLQVVHRQGLQVGQAAITRAEVVDQHLMADVPQGLQVMPGDHHIDQPTLGDFEGDLPRRHPMQRQQARHHLADPRHHDIAGRKVDRDVQVRVGPQQVPQLFEQALQDKIGDGADLPGVLRHGNEQLRTGQGAIRTAPAQQGLGADTLARLQIEDGLIQHLQLATTQRTL